ncbi:metallophosphoesterase, partial [Myxococcota bacterium]|nr:metallophosphoesterase [Myxococcota bacterium]
LLTGVSAIPVFFTLFRGLQKPILRRFSLSMAGVPPGGLKIAHVTDMHTGYFFGPSQVRALRDTLNSLDADLICLTGDQLHNTHGPFLTQLKENIGPLHASLGVFQVAGNHDHRLGKEHLFRELAKVGIVALDDRAVTLTKNGVPFQVIGIDDLNYGGDLERAMATLGEGRFRLLLSHRPRVLTEASQYNISLILAGHTHGGQMCIGKLCPSLFETPYTYGFYKEASTTLFVSSGAGTTGPPMRLFAPSEIVLFEISPEVPKNE